MVTHTETVTVLLLPVRASEMCREVLEEQGWEVVKKSTNLLLARKMSLQTYSIDLSLTFKISNAFGSDITIIGEKKDLLVDMLGLLKTAVAEVAEAIRLRGSTWMLPSAGLTDPTNILGLPDLSHLLEKIESPKSSESLESFQPAVQPTVKPEKSFEEMVAEFNETWKKRRKPTTEFDVFLCHNSVDKPAVRDIAKRLKACGRSPWLDEWELRPGLPWQELLEEQIGQIGSAAVFVGQDGFGPWQARELRGFLVEFVDRGCPVIPVLLSNAPKQPSLPIFLKGMTWVDFRVSDPDPLKRLIWGITGKRPDA
jgi:hypothetical protein